MWKSEMVSSVWVDLGLHCLEQVLILASLAVHSVHRSCCPCCWSRRSWLQLEISLWWLWGRSSLSSSPSSKHEISLTNQCIQPLIYALNRCFKVNFFTIFLVLPNFECFHFLSSTLAVFFQYCATACQLRRRLLSLLMSINECSKTLILLVNCYDALV